MKKGLLMVFTGDGKGKTTSALGLTVRAAGHGMKVCFIQFIKGSWKYGEMEAVKRFADEIDFHVMGRGFTWKSDDLEKDSQAAREAWEFAKEMMSSGRYQLIVLDGIHLYAEVRNDRAEARPGNLDQQAARLAHSHYRPGCAQGTGRCRRPGHGNACHQTPHGQWHHGPERHRVLTVDRGPNLGTHPRHRERIELG